jgi:hypothetical protein
MNGRILSMAALLGLALTACSSEASIDGTGSGADAATSTTIGADGASTTAVTSTVDAGAPASTAPETTPVATEPPATPAPTPAPTPSPTPAPTPAPPPAPPTTAPCSPEPSIPGDYFATGLDIRLGDCGEGVRQLQTFLNAGGAGLVVDGRFGRATEAAVKDLQRRVGFPETGVVDPETFTALVGSDPPPEA